jgi:hypothetical protein
MKEIYLTGERGRGLCAKVDDADYMWLSQYKWYLSSQGYAHRSEYENGKSRTYLMHREILGLDKRNDYTDHRDHDKLNNQRANIRKVSPSINSRNMKLLDTSTSGIRGVGYHKASGKYQARVNDLQKNRIHLGLFDTIAEATAARLEAEKKLGYLPIPQN